MTTGEAGEGGDPIRIPPRRGRRGRSLLRPIGESVEEIGSGLQYIESGDDLTEDTPPTAIPSSMLIALELGEDEFDEASIERDEDTAPDARIARPVIPVPNHREWVEVGAAVPVQRVAAPPVRPVVTQLVAAVLVGVGLAVLMMSMI